MASDETKDDPPSLPDDDTSVEARLRAAGGLTKEEVASYFKKDAVHDPEVRNAMLLPHAAKPKQQREVDQIGEMQDALGVARGGAPDGQSVH